MFREATLHAKVFSCLIAVPKESRSTVSARNPMDANQYKTELDRWRDVNRQNLIDLAQWAAQTALPWLWAELAGILGKESLDPLQPMHAIRQGLQTTPADRETMPLRPTFYHAHLTMLDSEARKYIDAVTRFNAALNPYAPNATIYNLHGGLEAVMDYGIILLEQAGHCILNLPGAYGAWARQQEHPFEIFSGARQIIYGRFSGLAHDDAAPFTPVAVLRTAIENRLRSAFGVYGCHDLGNQSIRQINLSELFDAIRPHHGEPFLWHYFKVREARRKIDEYVLTQLL